MSSHLTREAQTIAAIEFTALAYQLIVVPRQKRVRPRKRRSVHESAAIDASRARPDEGTWNSLRLAEFVRELRGDSRELEPGSAERMFRNYVKHLDAIVPGLECNLQAGYVSNYNNPAAQIRLCRAYFRTFSSENAINGLPSDHNDAAIRKYVYSAIALNRRPGYHDCARALLTLVQLRFAILHELRIGVALFTGDNLRFEEIIPRAVFCQGNTLMLAHFNPLRESLQLTSLAHLSSISPDLFQSYARRGGETKSDLKSLKSFLKERTSEAVCVIPFAHLAHCLGILPDFVDVDCREDDFARVKLRGSEAELRCALLHVLPYIRSVDPVELVERARQDAAKIASLTGARCGAI